MRGKWLFRVRQAHTFLGIFFSPLLLLFVVTGWWQTFITEDSPKNSFNDAMGKISNIHTDDYFTANGHRHHASGHFKILVAGMAVSLILTILLGLTLACTNRKNVGWAAFAFGLGILVPILILYFN